MGLSSGAVAECFVNTGWNYTAYCVPNVIRIHHRKLPRTRRVPISIQTTKFLSTVMQISLLIAASSFRGQWMFYVEYYIKDEGENFAEKKGEQKS